MKWNTFLRWGSILVTYCLYSYSLYADLLGLTFRENIAWKTRQNDYLTPLPLGRNRRGACAS
jgi:hypothetical protein